MSDEYNDVGSQEAYATIGSLDMQLALVLMSELSNETRKIGYVPEAIALRTLLRQLQGDLAALARNVARTADEAIVQHLRETQVRPETTRSLHLQDVVVSLPGSRGSVKIALIAELDKATNPDGYGPYWRAQEYGSEAVGNVMTGRILFGSFSGPAHDDVPRAQFAGARGAPGAQFHWGVSGEGGENGLGTIRHEDPPRRFLEAGLGAAGAEHGAAVRQLSRDYAERIAGLGAA